MRANVLGYPVDPLPVQGALSRVEEAIASSQRLQVVTLNAEMAMQGREDAELGAILKASQLVLPDGSGVVWAVRRQGIAVAKLAGIDFVGHLCDWAARTGKRVFLLGAAEGVALGASEVLAARYAGLQVVGVRSGFFGPDDEPALLAEIRAARVDLVFVALGVPRQEKWIARHQGELGVPVMMGVGGSFDVLADRIKRAPVAFQKLHLEWLFRLIQEPWRWRRMASTLPQFVYLVWSRKAGERS